MNVFFKRVVFVLSALSLMFLFSCASMTGRRELPGNLRLAYRIEAEATLLEKYAPFFVIENGTEPHNRIGTPAAELANDGKERIFVDPEKATVYARQAKFSTERGSYTNLIYRVHFEKVPSGIFPFHLGKGNNVGLLVIVTLDRRHDPVLYTTVHTCGCYLAFVPTSYLPAEAFPDNWRTERQSVYSENLPGILDYRAEGAYEVKTVIAIRDGSHRIKDIYLSREEALKKFRTTDALLRPMDTLELLPLENGVTTSFFETSGPRRGYVKGSRKPRERLFMSWWALDWRIGEDKKLGLNLNDGIVFYTSLKPWQRKKSDLRDFPRFLDFWGWQL